MEGRDYGDNQILQMTVQETEGGKVRFKTQLPTSDRVIVSEWMRPDDAKGSTVISWCENIRQQIDADMREEALRKKRDRDLADVVQEEAKEVSTEEATSPVEYAVHQRDMYIARCEVLEERLETTEIELKKMREHLEQWNVIVHNLRGEIDD